MPFADLPIGAHASHVRNHWWWRPGWRVGREFFTWHLTFEGANDLHRLVGEYQDKLRGLSGVHSVPIEWLHLTMQGVGFTDEVPADDLTRIMDAVHERLTHMTPFKLTFETAFVGDEAIVLPPDDEQAVADIRQAIREAIASIWGAEKVPDSASHFRPHVSVAYLGEDGGSAPYVTAVQSIRTSPATVTVRQTSLIALNRDDRMYKWRTHAAVRMGR